MALAGNVCEDPLPVDAKSYVVQGLWQQNTTPLSSSQEVESWDTYFRFYTAECRKAIEFEYGEHTTVRKHEDVAAIANQLESGRTKDVIKQSLLLLDTQQRSMDAKKQMAEGSVRLVVRLMSMVDIGPIPSNRVQGRAPLPWNDELSDLRTVLTNHFKRSSTDPEKIKFEEEFTAFNMQRLAGLKIQWTNNLPDHLRLIENDTKLCIFHQATFLKRQNSTIFPDGFAEETLRTLDLLFPRYDKSTQRWIHDERTSNADSIYPDLGLLLRDRMMSDDRRAAKFEYWRDHLITLKEKFDKPRPTSITQFWYDRRNKTQWYTFWIAVLVLCLTIFFGLVQSIEGALQVYKAYHPTPT